jgi:hypothetical protein
MVVVVTTYSLVRRFTDTHDPASAVTPLSALSIITGVSFSPSHFNNQRAAETDVTGRNDDIKLTSRSCIMSAVGRNFRSSEFCGISELRMRAYRPVLSWHLLGHTELNLTEPQDS